MNRDIDVEVLNTDYQRNGVGGEGFYAATIRCDGQTLLATIAYRDDGETFDDCSCRVVDPMNLEEHYRGDAIGCALIPKLTEYLKKEEQNGSANGIDAVPEETTADEPSEDDGEKNITATFYRCYDCELDISYDGGDLVSSCFITRGDYSASLAKAESEGTLDHYRTGEEINISDRVVETVRRWAEDNGY